MRYESDSRIATDGKLQLMPPPQYHLHRPLETLLNTYVSERYAYGEMHLGSTSIPRSSSEISVSTAVFRLLCFLFRTPAFRLRYHLRGVERKCRIRSQRLGSFIGKCVGGSVLLVLHMIGVLGLWLGCAVFI